MRQTPSFAVYCSATVQQKNCDFAHGLVSAGNYFRVSVGLSAPLHSLPRTPFPANFRLADDSGVLGSPRVSSALGKPERKLCHVGAFAAANAPKILTFNWVHSARRNGFITNHRKATEFYRFHKVWNLVREQKIYRRFSWKSSHSSRKTQKSRNPCEARCFTATKLPTARMLPLLADRTNCSNARTS